MGCFKEIYTEQMNDTVAFIVEQPELVHETILLRIAADPHAALRDGVDFVAGFLAAFGNVAEEFLVAVFDHRLHELFRVFAERAIDAELASALDEIGL